MQESEWEQIFDKMLNRYGKHSWREGQRELVRWAVSGESCLGILPTGYGKSLCYQVAAELVDGLSLVISPLIALMRDQVQSLCEYGVAAARYDSTLTEEEKLQVTQRVLNGELKLLYLAPESLEQATLLSLFQQVKLGLLVIDEAHCVSEWGHSFRPDYLRIASFAHAYPFHALMAMTATAPLRVQYDLQQYFHISPEHSYVLSPYRANITRYVAWDNDKDQNLIDFLSDEENRPSIVYCRTRQSTEELSYILQEKAMGAVAYHAGQSAELREQIQDKFLKGELDVLVATIAFGMGVDKGDVRSVVHYHAPSTPEAYVQESGRAGRDGKPATSLVLMNAEDDRDIRNRVLASQPEASSLLRCARWLLPESTRLVSLWELTTECDLNEDVPERALRLMEGSLKKEARLYKYYKIKPLFPLSTILDGRSEDECERLLYLDTHRDGSFDELVDAWGCSYEEAFALLQDCEAAQEWSLKLRQQAWLLRRTNDEVQPRDVAVELERYYESQKEQALLRWERMKTMLLSPDSQCLNQALNHYFISYEEMGLPCGHCPACLGETEKAQPDVAEPINPVCILRSELPAAFTDAQCRRLLLGLSSPALMRKRSYTHARYGSCRHLPWEAIELT